MTSKSSSPTRGELGQHINKAESAVQITHLPSGIVAVASDSRSQHTNRALALQWLIEKMEPAPRRHRAGMQGRRFKPPPAAEA